MKTVSMIAVILALCVPSIANAQEAISQQEMMRRVARTMKVTQHSNQPGPSTFSPSAYPSAPTTITTYSHMTIRSYRR